jgi:hypothetical protein
VLLRAEQTICHTGGVTVAARELSGLVRASGLVTCRRYQEEAMKTLLFAVVTALIVGTSWAEQAKPENGKPAAFRPGCEWALCALKVNGCKPFRGNSGTTEHYEAIAKKIDACNRGRESCRC